MSQSTPIDIFKAMISKHQEDGASIVRSVKNGLVTAQLFPTEFAADRCVMWPPGKPTVSEAIPPAATQGPVVSDE